MMKQSWFLMLIGQCSIVVESEYKKNWWWWSKKKSQTNILFLLIFSLDLLSLCIITLFFCSFPFCSVCECVHLACVSVCWRQILALFSCSSEESAELLHCCKWSVCVSPSLSLFSGFFTAESPNLTSQSEMSCIDIQLRSPLCLTEEHRLPWHVSLMYCI